jgi:hypothetical protein
MPLLLSETGTIAIAGMAAVRVSAVRLPLLEQVFARDKGRR